jgi:nucleoside-diphosphate-sugar epimerase
MIHRDDVVGVINAVLRDAPSGEVYNAVDNEPVTQLELFAWLSQRLGKPLPPTVSDDCWNSRRRGVTNKRVSNLRLREELSYKFKHPTFREGYDKELSGL